MTDTYAGEITPNDPDIGPALDRTNAVVLKLLMPLKPVIMADPAMPANFKADLYHRPVDAILGLLYPIESLVVDAVTFANDFSGKHTRTVGLGPQQTEANMDLTWPEDSQVTNPSKLAFIQRLRAVTNFMILTFYDPPALNVGIGKALVKRGTWVASQLEDLLVKLGIKPPPPLPPPAQVVSTARTGLLDMLNTAQVITSGRGTAVGDAASDLRVTAPVVTRFTNYLVKTGAWPGADGPYAGIANSVWTGHVMDHVWLEGDAIISDARNADSSLTTAPAHALIGRIIDGVNKIKNTGTALDDLRKTNPPALRGMLPPAMVALAAARFAKDGLQTIALSGLSRGGYVPSRGLGDGGITAGSVLTLLGEAAMAVGPVIAALITLATVSVPVVAPPLIALIRELITGRPTAPYAPGRVPKPGDPDYVPPATGGIPTPYLIGGALLALVLLRRSE